MGNLMSKARATKISAEVLQLVHTVERLAAEDQERIIKIVSLLTLVPSAVQQETQRRLKSLVDRNPRSMLDCVSGVDKVIEYLENYLLALNDTAGRDRFLYLPTTQLRN
jgi:hypothetical protein